jgi:hypothetical protein
MKTFLCYFFYTLSLLASVTSITLFGYGLWQHDLVMGTVCLVLIFFFSVFCFHCGVVYEEGMKEELQEKCTKIADTLPVKWSWGSGKENPKPWGCIITEAKENGVYHNWYCDQCPVLDKCQYNGKRFSQ